MSNRHKSNDQSFQCKINFIICIICDIINEFSQHSESKGINSEIY